MAGDMFGDLLGTQGFDFTSTKRDSGPKTINAMRKEELAKDIDPDKLKVSIMSNHASFPICIHLVKFFPLDTTADNGLDGRKTT